MNLVLLFVLIAEACIGICAWLSPEYLRRLAARFLTRADVIDMVRKETRRRMQFWSVELGVPERREESTDTFQEGGVEIGPHRVS
jgi:hypothetical protein